MFEAKVIKDSICKGQRLTTIQVTHPRIVHSEFMTHAMFARNASSSRAIPFKKTVEKVMNDPFIPEHWGINQSGMQAFTELQGVKREKAIAKWLQARDEAVRIATEMSAEKCSACQGSGHYSASFFPCPECGGDGLGLNVHKQLVNRIIEPWSWITVCVTGDASAWSNYFALRCHPDAQPDIKAQSDMAQLAYFRSTPDQLEPGEWHTPYIRPNEYEEIRNWVFQQNEQRLAQHLSALGSNETLRDISTGRCARTSYLTQEGTRDFAKDIELHDRLRYHTPMHASPFEHVCQAKGDWERYGKYVGWQAYRHMLPREYITDFQPNHPELVSITE